MNTKHSHTQAPLLGSEALQESCLHFEAYSLSHVLCYLSCKPLKEGQKCASCRSATVSPASRRLHNNVFSVDARPVVVISCEQASAIW